MRSFSRRPVASLFPLACVVATLAPAVARAAPTAQDMAAVEAAIRKVAAEATPKTVCIRVRMRDGREGFGSGAVISADGLVLTCAHVTEPSRGGSLTAVFPNGTEAGLLVVGSNAHNDYALCRVDGKGKDLPHFEIAPVEPIPGDWVVALGHPGGPYADHKPTVAAGKVTGLNRSLPIMMEGKEYVGAIQTDAPLFGGNSGGPLVDLFGRLVGINGAILLVGDASFASSAVRIAKDLPTLKAGKSVDGAHIESVFESMQELASELDPDALSDAIADEGLKAILKAVSSMGALGGAPDGKPKAARRLDDLKAAYSVGWPRAAAVFSNERRIAWATPVGVKDGRPLYLTTARAGRTDGELRIQRPSFAQHGRVTKREGPVGHEARVRGVDGEWDLALLDFDAGAEPDQPLPALAAAADVVPGSFVLLPAMWESEPFQAGVIAAVDRTVGTERKIPTLGIIRLFQPPHTTPFRPYPAMIQIDCPLEADEMGGPVVRPDGSLVGIAVAHFNRGATMVVPAKVLAERIERMLQGIDDPAPKTYGPPPRPPPDRALRAAKEAERRADADALTLYVPTLAGVLRPVKFRNASAGGAGPTAPDDSGAGPLDVRAGDVFLSIDSKPVADTAAARAAIAALAAGAHAAVVLRRADGHLVPYDAIAEGDGSARKLALRALGNPTVK